MQKFVIVKKMAEPTGQDVVTETQVRMSGYLKKKRNKVGGWRKQWFVLQNKLLLSYSSREDYEKKLVPFKDAINLVPGTVVRPAAGSRFTIETTSNAIYMFRCDTTKNCAEWIMALLDSLSLGGQTVIDKNSSNMPNPKIFTKIDRTLNILTSSKPTKSAILPIAVGTKRLLERGGVDGKNYVLNESSSKDKTVQNFRLHQNALKQHQSKDVSRINRMFNRCVTEKMDLNQNKTKISEIEEQIQQMTLGDETENELDKKIDGPENGCKNQVKQNFEPIYAVVDLKDKYARRAQLKEIEEKTEKERPKSFCVIASDYEDVNNLSCSLGGSCSEEDNIYEPINISEQTRKNMWKYFPKINFDSLIEFARQGRNKPKDIEYYDEPNQSTAFSDMRKKLGNHRRSIKNKMRKMYSREERIKTRNLSSDDVKISPSTSISQNSNRISYTSSENESEKNITNVKLPKRERKLFGSLGRLRKPRTAICMDSIPKKKLLVTSSNDFQIELKKEISRRCDDKN